ncbi:MAG TPA: site-2 protease family protein, partial [Pirellulales bacterium]|nr:site-2 protease family protein [Pirellulales bacterium]
TKYSLSLVFRFLRKIMTGQVSVKGMGGPVEIAKQAGATASEGMSPFLLFLGMLSANLAVLNFLPIPMLDGGHMVFLAAEGVRGKPVSEQVVAYFQFAGLFFLASLMLFVLLLDVGLIPRG